MVYDMVIEGHAVDALTDWGYIRIGIRDGVIDTISNGVPIEGKEHIVVPRESIIVPGLINTHCHMREPGYTEAEDFESYGRVAAAGGITTSFDQTNNPGCPTITLERMEEKRRLSLAKAPHMDIRFWAGVRFEPSLNLEQLEMMLELAYVVGAKSFWCRSTGGIYQPNSTRRYVQQDELYEFMSEWGQGKPVSNHCENEEMNLEGEERLKGAGRDDPTAVPDSRPGYGEELEADSALVFGIQYDVPVVICHASTRGTIDTFDDYISPMVMMEFTPHHYMFSREDMESPMLKMYPPLRPERDRDAVRARLAKGKNVTIGTDHAPHPVARKKGNIWEAAAGIPNDEHMGAFVGHLIRNGMDAGTAARVSSYNAAQFFGMEDRGLIEEGMRADLVVLDMDNGETIGPPYFTKCGWSPYEGMDFGARVTHTIAKGKLVLEDGELRI